MSALHDGSGEIRMGAEAGAGGRQDELRIGRRTELIDAEDVEAGAAAANRHAFVIPERRRRRDPASEQIGDGIEADRDRVQPCRNAPRSGHDRA